VTINASGPIGLGSIGVAGASIEAEVGYVDATVITMNDYAVRALGQTYTNASAISFSTLLGKTYPTYAVSPSASSVNEGVSVNFTITTTNIPAGYTLYWTILGGTGIAAADFSGGALSGSFAVITGGVNTLTITPLLDMVTEGNETFQVQVRTVSIAGTIVATSSVVTVVDMIPTFAISTPAAINEGSAATFTVTTTNVPDGTILYYSTAGTVVAADFTDATLTGSFTITSNTGTITRTALADNLTEGAENFTISVRTGSTAGTVVATSGSVTINDTSITIAGQVLHVGYDSLGTDGGALLSWVVPNGVTSISVVCIGGGGGGPYTSATTNGGGSAGGGGGGLAYVNNITVTPGETITLRAGNGGAPSASPGTVQAGLGGYSQIYRPATPTTYLVRAGGGAGGIRNTTASAVSLGGAGGTPLVGTGGTGGNGGGGLNGNNTISSTFDQGGGGGAGGYSGAGGRGGGYLTSAIVVPVAGSGGGGGGGGDKQSTGGTVSAPSLTNNYPGIGGGASPLGLSTSGAAGTNSGAGVAGNGTDGGGGGGAYLYGAGGAAIPTPSGSAAGRGGYAGCIRVIWPGNTRQFPSTGTADQ
jgi:hypothetical protein